MLDKGIEESVGVKAGGGGGTKRAGHHLGHHGLGDLGSILEQMFCKQIKM